MDPQMAYGEMVDVSVTSDRHQVRLIDGEIKVSTITVEDEKKGKKSWLETKKRGERPNN